MVIYTDINEAVLRNVPPDSFVLDVGCGSGTLGAKLKQKGCRVWGIDNSQESINIARNQLDKVFLADASEYAATYASKCASECEDKQSPNKTKAHPLFDCIIFADVLEHLVQPESVLRQYISLLKPEGRIIISLPNISNWTIRLKLLFGSFKRTETGILDKTHLHFYTLKSAKSFVKKAGLEPIKIDLTPNFVRSCLWLIKIIMNAKGKNIEANETHERLFASKMYQFYRKNILPFETAIAKCWKGLLAYQIVLVAKIGTKKE